MPQSRPRPSAAPAPALPARYESIRLLGRGGMSSVWCARDTVLGRKVAVKLLAESFTSDERARRRFMREARAAARLSGHPHVVTIFDVGECDGRPYLVMEHVAGGTVADAIRLRAYSREEALVWIAQAAAALDHAHAAGVLHRDVKPSNMLLATDRTLRLGDFGLASLSSEQTLSGRGELLGTAAYISPEQALGEPASPASDRYSLAVAAFELLTGERPFDGPTMVASAREHIERAPPAPSLRDPRLPDAVDEVLRRGLAKRPADRWASARELAGALARALAEAPARALAEAAPARALAEAPAGEAIGSSQTPARGALAPRARRSALGRGALGALVVMALAAGALAGVLSLSAGPSGRRAGAHRHGPPAQELASIDHPTPAAPHRAGRQRTPREGAAWMESRGHTLMLQGRYAQALAILRQAVSRASHRSLTYAYALFDLGRTLALDGHPRAAIPILERRLRIPNQPQVVLDELIFAEREAGLAVPGSSPAATRAGSRDVPRVRGHGLPESAGARAGQSAPASPATDGPPDSPRGSASRPAGSAPAPAGGAGSPPSGGAGLGAEIAFP